MSIQTAKRARLSLYKLKNPGHVLTAAGVQVEVRYYTRAYVRVGELGFPHHFKVLEILPDVLLGLPWLRGHNPTVNWKEWYADIQHGSSSYRLSFDESRHSTQLQFQAASKLDLLSTLLSSTSKTSPVGSCNGSSDSTQIIHQCDQNFNDSQMYISAVNFPLIFMFSVRRQMSPVSARRVAFLKRLRLHGQNHTKCTQSGPCRKIVFHMLCFLKTEY